MSEPSAIITPSPVQVSSGSQTRPPLTPEQVRKIELDRLKAKALRDQKESEARKVARKVALSTHSAGSAGSATSHAGNGNLAAGAKRPYSSISASNTPATLRDGRSTNAMKNGVSRPLDDIRPARNFTKFVQYDFSKMTDTRGGFLTKEDDPHNKALYAPGTDGKPAHMTMKEWEKHQLLKSLREQKIGPYEPGLSAMKKDQQPVCRECSSMEIDWKWAEALKCCICNSCKDKYPDKYSLLTKTEARADYLLTEPELKDEEALPRLERPNPHKSTWNNMILYLRYQLEDFVIQRRGSLEAVDALFEEREVQRKEKEKKKRNQFQVKLQELKKRTRVEAYRRSRQTGAEGGGGGDFGDDLTRDGKHTHTWGRSVENDEGICIKTCVECGMDVEELEF